MTKLEPDNAFASNQLSRITCQISCLPREPAQEAIFGITLLHDLITDNLKPLELARRHTIRIERIDVRIRAVLRLGLQKVQASHDEQLCTNEQEHNLAAPVQLIWVDEVWEDGRQHECRELLADEDERDRLGSSGLGRGLLSDGPAVAAYGRGVEH